jgi:DNA-binding winged helix-turn-helix (wHTH) protein
MNASLTMPNPRHKRMDPNGSQIVAERAIPATTEATLEFGRFRVLPRQRRLMDGAVPVVLGTRAFDILMVLIEADGALVTKDELQSRVWPGLFVGSDNLKVHVSALRKALGDRELIQTDHGRGYRFTAAVRSAVAAPECVPRLGATMAKEQASSPADLLALASRLTRLEVRLAEALSLLGTHPKASRLRRRRCHAGHFRRRTQRPRPIGSAWPSIGSHGKVSDAAC